jgi:hypothetical protein
MLLFLDIYYPQQYNLAKCHCKQYIPKQKMPFRCNELKGILKQSIKIYSFIISSITAAMSSALGLEK